MLLSDLTELTNLQVKTVQFNNEIEVSASSAIDISQSRADSGFADGDTIIGIVGYFMNNGTSGGGRSNTFPYAFYWTGTRFEVSVRNTSTSSVWIAPCLYVLYIPEH